MTNYAELHHLVRTGADPDRVRRWLREILGAVAEGRQPISGVRHPLGFVCLPVHRASDEGICVHLWSGRVAGGQASTSTVHCHSWDLLSYVVFGQLRNTLIPVVDDPSDGDYRVFEVRSGPLADDLLATSRLVRCEEAVVEQYSTGDTYSLPAGRFHTTHVPARHEAATLALGTARHGMADLSLGPVAGATHAVRRGRYSVAETARAARLVLEKLDAPADPAADPAVNLPPVTGDPPLDLSRAERVAVAAAEKAGALLSSGADEEFAVRRKGRAGDLVTNLDVAAEKVILDQITAAFPGHQVIAEECGTVGADSAHVWLVDPLDGTNNVVIGLSNYVVGVALCADRVPLLGVVHEPASGATWTAIRGGGARGPGGPVRAGGAGGRGDVASNGPVLGWTQGHGVARDDPTARALKLVLDSRSRRVLQLWAPLLTWVMLARGDIDGIVGYRAEGIDFSAGALIATEAGIVIRELDGAPFDDRIALPLAPRSFLAARPESVGQLVELVAVARGIEQRLSEACGPEITPRW